MSRFLCKDCTEDHCPYYGEENICYYSNFDELEIESTEKCK